jgi:hypothetical protein
MKKLFKVFILVFFLTAGVPRLWAQTSRYVVSAELHLSMTHPLWPDVFLNGHQLVDAQDHVFDRTSQIDLAFNREQLCYFTSVNCLALEVPQTLGSTTGTNASIGLAYVLKVVYSDNNIDWITSDQGKTRRYFIKKDVLEPSGWTIAGFDDQAWPLSRIFTPTSASATLMNPQTNLPAKYLPTFKDSPRIYLTLGQKMLFRRKYFRDITAPPDCGEPVSKLAPLKVQPMPSPISTTVIVPTLTFTPTAYTNGYYQEPLAQPNLASRLEASTQVPPTPAPPQVVLTQVPTATLQPVWTPSPTLTPTLVWTNTPLPTATPRPLIRHKPKKHRSMVTITPTQTSLPLAPVFTATAVVTAIVKPDSSMAATIVFAAPPVNINASFADGPGVYQLEIVDAKGTHLNTLYNQQVVLEKDTWITWDGTNDDGRLMGAGNYIARLSKDGVLIEKIALTWIIPNASQSNP